MRMAREMISVRAEVERRTMVGQMMVRLAQALRLLMIMLRVLRNLLRVVAWL